MAYNTATSLGCLHPANHWEAWLSLAEVYVTYGCCIGSTHQCDIARSSITTTCWTKTLPLAQAMVSLNIIPQYKTTYNISFLPQDRFIV